MTVELLAKNQQLLAARTSLARVLAIVPDFADQPEQMRALLAAVDAIKAYIQELEDQLNACT